MTEYEKREECISNLIQQIGWIEDIDSHKFPGWGHTVNAMQQALALLKAQEPVAPIFDYDGLDVWRCGNCHSNIFHPTRTDEDENEKNYRRFCFHCGRAVKWNG